MLKVLAINMDNASSNDKQTCKLATLDNSFEAFNRVRCFNHTLQLAAKALLRPLNPGILGGSHGSSSQAIVSEHDSEVSFISPGTDYHPRQPGPCSALVHG